ncbi:MAG: YiiX/YebB-like N1pC/P60 family cysteine hydrolase [Planctomycetota bacterium]
MRNAATNSAGAATTVVSRCARSLLAIAPTVVGDEEIDILRGTLESGIARGYFTPDEDHHLRHRFAQYLTARAVLLGTIEELRPLVFGRVRLPDGPEQWRAFAVGYAASCLLVRAGRAIVGDLAVHDLARKKLNEPAPEYGIAAGQFTGLYRSLTRPKHAWRLLAAREFAAGHREHLEALRGEPRYDEILTLIDLSEAALQMDTSEYVAGRLRYQRHSWLRRHASALQRATFALLEGSGRVVSEIHWPWYRKRLNKTVVRKLGELLQPGDVMITRHNDAMTNLFLPGFWPHAALHIGLPPARESLGIRANPDVAERWTGEIRVLEARKDGVLLRELPDTLSVDAVAVLRPRLADEQIAEALSRALEHEGKDYDFSFDFFHADRLVCTEVVYRGFDGVGGLQLELTERARRMTLSAEDLLQRGVDGKGWDIVAVFGTPRSRRRIVTGEKARELVAATLAPSP